MAHVQLLQWLHRKNNNTTEKQLNIASPFPQYKGASDNNCGKGCRLQYGVSEVFEKILQELKIRETAQCFPNELYHQQNPRSCKKNVNVGI